MRIKLKTEFPSKTENTIRVNTHSGIRESLLLLFLAIGAYLFLSLLTYTPSDPGWTSTGATAHVHNLGGYLGAWLADLFLSLIGYFAYGFPLVLGAMGVLFYRGGFVDTDSPWLDIWGIPVIGFLLTVLSGCGLVSLHFISRSLPLGSGGLLGHLVGTGLEKATGEWGATLIFAGVFLAGITLATGLSWLQLALGGRRLIYWLFRRNRLEEARDNRGGKVPRRSLFASNSKSVQREKNHGKEKTTTKSSSDLQIILPQSSEQNKIGSSNEGRHKLATNSVRSKADKTLPDAGTLLDPAISQRSSYSKDSLESMSRLVEEKLSDFGIDVKVEAVHPGPVITRFELLPAPGIKVSRISNLAKDLARALSVVSVRIVEVIAGKSVIGLEIPNEYRETIALSEILQSDPYLQAKSDLTLALGKNISGDSVVADLGRMPHLLVAGTTGSGKSVAVNAMLLSLLFKATPQQVRMILIDPKMLELSVYDGIPHLLTPVVTDMKDAANALRWCVAEMERRYLMMSKLGVRNLAGYNRKVGDAIKNGTPIPDPLASHDVQQEGGESVELDVIPSIVVVVDEFADMMMVVGKKVEELIARLAQKARAAGIHLILATQRPSVDVITGLIKANIPSRIAFQVSSRIDSRTILDQQGAEQLLGAGDMLYLPPGRALPDRVHGAFVSDQEVHRVVDDLKCRGEPDYIDEIINEPLAGGGGLLNGDDQSDVLYDQALAIVTETRKASISYIQRQLKIGYNRAARMVEEMERTGVVSPVQSNGNREVLAPPPPDR